ncbi:thymidylate synthase [Desulfitispora alkaliphila]|uniref:DUF6557 family protein n=1 Tax=Desulfitispora alkaliphila TaxID=622674 RepID=UPI003D22FB23
MLLKELLNSVNYDDVWEIIDKEYELKEGAYKAYKQVFEELKSMNTNLAKSQFTLVVAKIEDCFTPGEFIFEVFGVKEDDENYYALEMTPWEEWNGLPVLDKSIEVYGAAAIAAHALHEMTFYGYSAEAVAKRVAEEVQILKERLEEIENGTVELLSHEEVMAEWGITDNRTPQEKEQQQKEFERINAKNIEVYKMLLGDS